MHCKNLTVLIFVSNFVSCFTKFKLIFGASLFILDQPLRGFAIKNIQYFFAVQSLTPSGIFQAEKTKNRFSANVIFIENMISPFLGKRDFFFKMNFRTTNSVFCENAILFVHKIAVLFCFYNVDQIMKFVTILTYYLHSIYHYI
jgi:hypothetical protein